MPGTRKLAIPDGVVCWATKVGSGCFLRKNEELIDEMSALRCPLDVVSGLLHCRLSPRRRREFPFWVPRAHDSHVDMLMTNV